MQRLFLKRRLRLLPQLHAQRLPHQYGDDVGSSKKMSMDYNPCSFF